MAGHVYVMSYHRWCVRCTQDPLWNKKSIHHTGAVSSLVVPLFGGKEDPYCICRRIIAVSSSVPINSDDNPFHYWGALLNKPRAQSVSFPLKWLYHCIKASGGSSDVLGISSLHLTAKASEEWVWPSKYFVCSMCWVTQLYLILCRTNLMTIIAHGASAAFFRIWSVQHFLSQNQSMLLCNAEDSEALTAEPGSFVRNTVRVLLQEAAQRRAVQTLPCLDQYLQRHTLLFTGLETDSRHSQLILTPVHYRNINLMQTAQQKLMSIFRENQIKSSFIS